MRNRLIHVYFDIDIDRVWDTITDDLPKLIADLEKASAQDVSESAVPDKTADKSENQD